MKMCEMADKQMKTHAQTDTVCLHSIIMEGVACVCRPFHTTFCLHLIIIEVAGERNHERERDAHLASGPPTSDDKNGERTAR